ncbi:MAG: hypothetical protein K0R33_3852 [Mycobacterium sp.]|nr:hypothetical protein [Mycobacterium sp.]
MTADESLWRRVWDRLSLGHLRWIALVAILAVSAAFGGLDQAHHVKPLALGDTYTAGPLAVTAKSVTVVDYLPHLAELTPECRYLVLAVTVRNTGAESVPLQPLSTADQPEVTCRDFSPASPSNVFELVVPESTYIGAFRGSTFATVPVVEPGFTADYSVVWLLSLDRIRQNPDYVIRIYEMAAYISTFRIAKDWGRTEVVKYAELKGAA